MVRGDAADGWRQMTNTRWGWRQLVQGGGGVDWRKVEEEVEVVGFRWR